MRTKILFLALAIGLCACGTPADADPSACTVPDECDPTAPNDDKATCDDADPATIDRCVETDAGGWVCASIRAECDGADPADVQQARCDDDDPCTADRCLVSACVHMAFGGCQ